MPVTLVERIWFRVVCQRHHAWRGWELTKDERSRVRCPVTIDTNGTTTIHGVTVSSWSRRPCKICRGRDDEMQRRPA